MNRLWLAVAALVVVLGASSVAFAHDGHPHRFLGTLSSVHGNQLEVKTTDGKTAVFILDGKSVIQQGRAKADAKDLKVGERIVVTALEVAGGKPMTAINVQLRVVTPTPAAGTK
jgi:hypothetical protein